jgi:hypothetical protein
MESVQQNYIGGTWVPAGATAPNVNPSNLNDVVANYARPLFCPYGHRSERERGISSPPGAKRRRTASGSWDSSPIRRNLAGLLDALKRRSSDSAGAPSERCDDHHPP